MNSMLLNYDHVNDMRMQLSANKNVTFLIVEGDTELKILRNLKSNNCSIMNLGGKSKVIEAYKKLRTYKRCLFIVDADYSYYTKRSLKKINLIETEYNDIECVLMYSNAFNKVMYNMLHGKINSDNKVYIKMLNKSIEIDDFLNLALKIQHTLGRCRIANYKYNLNLSLDKVSASYNAKVFENFESIKQLDRAFTQHALNIIKKHNKTIYTSEVDKKIKNELKNKKYCKKTGHGHDLGDVLGSLLKYLSIPLRGTILERFILAFEKDHFTKTKLFKNIRKYEKYKNVTFIMTSL